MIRIDKLRKLVRDKDLDMMMVGASKVPHGLRTPAAWCKRIKDMADGIEAFVSGMDVMESFGNHTAGCKVCYKIHNDLAVKNIYLDTHSPTGNIRGAWLSYNFSERYDPPPIEVPPQPFIYDSLQPPPQIQDLSWDLPTIEFPDLSWTDTTSTDSTS